jgi:hypothetical protein
MVDVWMGYKEGSNDKFKHPFVFINGVWVQVTSNTNFDGSKTMIIGRPAASLVTDKATKPGTVILKDVPTEKIHVVSLYARVHRSELESILLEIDRSLVSSERVDKMSSIMEHNRALFMKNKCGCLTYEQYYYMMGGMFKPIFMRPELLEHVSTLDVKDDKMYDM